MSNLKNASSQNNQVNENNEEQYLPGVDYEPGEIIIKFGEEGTNQAKNNILNSLKAEKIESSADQDLTKLTLKTPDVEEVVKELEKNPLVEIVEPNFYIEEAGLPNDPQIFDSTNKLRWNYDKIDAPEAWDIETGSSNQIRVAVLDTGVDYNHQDLVDNIWTNPGEIANDKIDNDGNGYIDDIHGYDFADNDANPMASGNHGTKVAGIIGATGNNSVGISGIAWDVEIIPLKIFGSKTGTAWAAANAIKYAIDQDVHITNNSWITSGFSQTLYDAVEEAASAGQLLIAGAGNYGENSDLKPQYPASFDLDNVISVAASDKSDALLSGSNYGPTSVDLAAPGTAWTTDVNNGYGFLGATSAATAHVSGAAALIWANDPSLTAAQVKERLLLTVDKSPALEGKVVSGGRLNVHKALQGLAKGGIQGQVWNDVNQNGKLDSNESGLSGIKVYLDQNQNGKFDSNEQFQLTNNTGNYSFTNLEPGNYSVGQVLPNGAKQTAPNEIVYKWTDSKQTNGPKFNWVEISSVGTSLSLGDDGEYQLNLPFNFPFYDEVKNTLKIGANGYLTFGSFGKDYTNDPIPNISTPNDYIAPFWDDLNPNNGGSVYYYHDQANNQFIVEYQNIPTYNSKGTLTFEVILKPDGNILFQYDQVSGTTDSGTIGIENVDGTKGLEVAYNKNYVENKLAVNINSNSASTHEVSLASGETLANINFGIYQGSGNNNPGVIGEVGSISNLTHNTQTITLKNNYINPVVIVQPPSSNESDPATVRLTNISNNSFTVKLQETSNLDGVHAAEAVSYIVVEEGSWELSNGTLLEVGNLDTNKIVTKGQWNTVNFDQNFDSTPVVISQVQTNNDSELVRTRQNKVGLTSFDLGLEEEELSKNSGHGQEKIGWLAIEPGAGTLDGLSYQADYTGNSVGHNWKTINFQNNLFSNTPRFLASISSLAGLDPVELRYQNLGAGQVSLKVLEDTTLDLETTHANENIGFLAIQGNGDILGF